jgi:hypothetical protein
MKILIRRYHVAIEWLLAAFVVVSAAAVWYQGRELDESITIYDVFPPLGLMAFGLMWTHFIMGALRRYSEAPKRTRDVYMIVSMGIVLALIVLHPGLLWLGLYLDGFGLPPVSYLTAYQTQLLAVLLGSLGLTIFLAFELKRWFGRKKWWRFIEWAQIIGMTAIFFHALQLGNELRTDWYALVWWLYGITLLIAIIYTVIYNRRKRQ